MSARRPRRASGHPVRSALLLFALALFLGASWLLAKLYELPPKTIDAARLSAAPYANPVWVGNVASPLIREASGFARSLRDPARLWVINDGGNPPVLHAIGLDGSDQGAVAVRGVDNEDWEDLASVEREGTPYLLIPDTGDNLSRKSRRTLYAVEEPEFASGAAPTGVSLAWQLAFRFEDGPRDCEAVAVDPESGEILLLSKRDVPARLYALAWPDAASAKRGEPATARFVTEVLGIPQPTREDGEGLFPFGTMLAQPTALDVAPDGRAAIVLTYGAAYRFAREPGESWRSAFRQLPGRIAMPPILGAEALGFAPGGASFLLGSEGRRAPLYRYDELPRAARGSRTRETE